MGKSLLELSILLFLLTLYRFFFTAVMQQNYKLETIHWKKPRKRNVINNLSKAQVLMWPTVSESFVETFHAPL